ncbi:lipopolysaccharide biosynthesis protein [Mucilaginibacter sp. UYCu711]|uniref:lipopolysaccharide biosynthesis protein n=1 Tax=Mucilaginibacter sp. UYCu711 TaxID=3156339 RepID=UPI003D21F82D
MGIVKKQAYKNTFVSYAGMIIGFVNLILLYPRFLTTEQIGLFQLLIGLSVLYSIIASMGVPSIIVRYFPFYRTDDNTHHNFLRFTGKVALIGFAISTLVFFAIKPIIVISFKKKAELFVEYYYYLVPLAFFTIFFNFLEAFGKVIYQSIYSAVLKEVVLRLVTTITMLMLALGWIDFQQFIVIYVLINGVVCLSLLVSLATTGKFSYRRSSVKHPDITHKEVLNFGLFTFLSSAIYVMLQNVDKYMLSAMAGLAVQGVYSLYSGIAIVISVPQAALSRTTYQIVSDAWKSKNMAAIEEVYYKTSIIQMVVGFLLFVGILVNKENLLTLLHKKEYADQFNVLIMICLGFLVDVTGGLNTYIVTTSHKYKLITILVLIWSIICVVLTYLAIPKYGGMGAAGAYLITIAGINFCTWFYIKYRFKMQPFTFKHILVIGIAIISYFAGKYFWRMPNVFLDLVVRSGITTIVYGVLAYYLKISTDINDKVDATLQKALHIIK